MPPKKRASAKGTAVDAPAAKKAKDIPECEIEGRTVRWEWEDGRGKWIPYSRKNGLALTDALSKEMEEISIQVEPKVRMLVSLKFRTQTNEKTGFESSIRMSIKDSSDGEFYYWQWQDKQGKWNPYEASACLELEEGLESEFDRVEFMAYDCTFILDFPTMTQSNGETGVEKKARRIKLDNITEAEPFAREDDNPPFTSPSSSVAEKKEEEEEEEEEVPKKGRGRKSARKSAAKSGRGKRVKK